MSAFEELLFTAEFEQAVEHLDMPTHAHTGEGCEWCRVTSTGAQAAVAGMTAVSRDEEWSRRAKEWLYGLPSGRRFTADDLVDYCGKPSGSSNQIGAALRSWATRNLITAVDVTTAGRQQSHSRLLRVWEVAW